MTTPDVQYRARHAIEVLEDEGILDHPLGRHQTGLKDVPEQPASPVREANFQARESIKKAGHATPSEMILGAVRACLLEFRHGFFHKEIRRKPSRTLRRPCKIVKSEPFGQKCAIAAFPQSLGPLYQPNLRFPKSLGPIQQWDIGRHHPGGKDSGISQPAISQKVQDLLRRKGPFVKRSRLYPAGSQRTLQPADPVERTKERKLSGYDIGIKQPTRLQDADHFKDDRRGIREMF